MASGQTKIGIILEAFDRVTGPLKGVNAALDSIRRPVADIQKGFRSLSVAAGIPQMTKSIVGVGSAAGRVGSEVMALGRSFMIYGGLAAAGIGAVVHSAVEAASRLNDLSTSTGFGVESLQTLGFAFGQVGGNAQMFEGAIEKFTQGMGQARAGTGKLAALLKRVDPALLNTIRKSKDTGDAFRAMLAGVSKAKTDAEKMALAAAAFGKEAAVPIVNLAKGGPEGLKQLESMIPHLTGEGVKALADLNDSLDRLKSTAFASLSNVFAGIAPALKGISEGIASAFADPAVINGLKEWGKEFGDRLPGRIERLKTTVGDLWRTYLRPLWNGLKWIAESGARLKVALGALAAIVGGKLLLAVGGLAKALIGLGWTLLTTPIGWFLGIVAALGVAAYVLIKHWDDVKAFFSKMWDTPLGKLALLTSPITWLVLIAREIIRNWGPIKAFFIGLWDSPLGKVLRFITLIDAFTALAGTIRENWEPIKAFFEGLFGAIRKQIADTIAEMEKFSDPGGVQKKIREGFRWMVTPQESEAPSLGAGKTLGSAMSLNRTNNAAVAVRFENLPRGARVSSETSPGMPFDLDYSYMGIQGAPT